MKRLLLIFLILNTFSTAYGEVRKFTSKAAFQEAITSFDQVEQDFEAITVETEFPSGSTVNELTFTYDILGDLIVVNDWDAPSGENYLGVAGDNAFLSGDRLELTFEYPAHAIGLYIIGATGDIYENDFTLLYGGNNIQNSRTPDLLLPDGGEAFFVGFMDDSLNPFTTISIVSNELVGYEFHIDDIIIADSMDIDNDEDGFSENEGDLDDTDPSIHPDVSDISLGDLGSSSRGISNCFINTARF